MRPDAHRDLKQFGGIRLRSVTLRSTERDRLLARLRLERALDAVDWTPRGLPAGGLLLVRRLVATRGGRTTLARTVTQALHEHSRNARRPWLDEHAAEAEAVWFDRGELAACMARDALRGRVSQRWWWPGVLEGRDPGQWLREHVLDHGERVVSLLAMLCARDDAVAWLRRLPDSDAARGLDALVHDYAVPSVEYQTRQASSPDLDNRNINVTSGMPKPGIATTAPIAKAATTAVAHTAQVSTSFSASPRAVARLLAAAPELLSARLGAQAQRLLAHARVAIHDPNWLRSREFVDTLNRWIDSQAVTGIDPAALERHEPAIGVIRDTRPGDSPPVRIIDTSEALVAGSSRTHQAVAPDREVLPRFPDTAAPARVIAMEPDLLARSAQVEISAAANGPDPQTRIEPNTSDLAANMDAADTGTIPSPILDPATQIDDSPTPSPPEPFGDEHSAHAIDTEFGGLLYLLNVALALELYGDFTSPRTPGIALSPWDWLAMIARAWFGASFRNDPLDAVLAELAGRGAHQSPGADFDPGRDGSMPDAWLRPWGEVDRLGYRADADRLRIEHPQGFVVFDQPRDRGLSPAVQAANLCATRDHLRGATLQRMARSPSPGRSRQTAQRWLDRLLPYLHARIALALGLDARDAELPALLCRHRARVRCDLAHLDVHLSLASLPLSLRIAGLDRDPGWIPAAGRSIRFHFDGGGFDGDSFESPGADTTSPDRTSRDGDRA